MPRRCGAHAERRFRVSGFGEGSGFRFRFQRFEARCLALLLSGWLTVPKLTCVWYNSVNFGAEKGLVKIGGALRDWWDVEGSYVRLIDFGITQL